MRNANQPRIFGMTATRWATDRLELFTALEKWVVSVQKKEAGNFTFHAEWKEFYFLAQHFDSIRPFIKAECKATGRKGAHVFQFCAGGKMFEVKRLDK